MGDNSTHTNIREKNKKIEKRNQLSRNYIEFIINFKVPLTLI